MANNGTCRLCLSSRILFSSSLKINNEKRWYLGRSTTKHGTAQFERVGLASVAQRATYECGDRSTNLTQIRQRLNTSYRSPLVAITRRTENSPTAFPCATHATKRNKVVLRFGKSMGVVKFLIEQVYCKGVRLAEKYLNAFKRFVSREKNRKAKKKREPMAVSSSSRPMTYGPKSIEQVSKFDLSHRSSVVALSQCFDQVWKDEEAVHESHVHSSVRDGWFPIVEGRGRVQYRRR